MNILQQPALTSTSNGLLAACKNSCKKLLSAIGHYKMALLREFGQNAFNQDHLLDLALNEAEALAYDSGFPLLIFPSLAREKVQAVAAWRLQQQNVRRTSFARLTA